MSALLLSRGETYSSHGQVLGRFNKEFVHPGMFPKEFTTVLTRLFEDRQSGDYDFIAGVTEIDARQDVADAQRMVKEIHRYLTTSESEDQDPPSGGRP